MSMIAVGIVAGFVGFVAVLAVETLRDCFTIDQAADKAVDEIARECFEPRVRVGSRSTCPGRDPHDRSAA